MTTQLRSEELDDGIVTLWLDSPERGGLVVLDQWLLDQLHLFLDEFEAREEQGGLIVLSASPRVFVAGADLSDILSLPDEELHAYLTEGAEAFARISELPCATAAGVSGAALGGGLELAMHCDSIIAAKQPKGQKPYRVGLPEASLGLCPGWGGTQMLPARIDPAAAIEMMAIGFTPTFDEMPEGLFARVIENPADLQEAAVRHILDHQKKSARRRPVCIDDQDPAALRRAIDSVRDKLPENPAAHAVVEAVEVGLQNGWVEGVAAERRLLVGLRHTEAARRRIEQFFARK
jgi:enoyl-CoA hydratase/carnithine racemase